MNTWANNIRTEDFVKSYIEDFFVYLGKQFMNREQVLQVVSEWLREAVLPPLTPRELRPLDLRKQRTILAVAGPRRAGKTYYLYQLIQGLIESNVAIREDI